MGYNFGREEFNNFIFWANLIFTILFINYLAIIWAVDYELEPREKDLCAIGFFAAIIYFFFKVFFLMILSAIRELGRKYELKKTENQQDEQV